MDSKGIRRLALPLRPKGRLSAGRKAPPCVSARSLACGRWLSHILSWVGACCSTKKGIFVRIFHENPFLILHFYNSCSFSLEMPSGSGRIRVPPHRPLSVPDASSGSQLISHSFSVTPWVRTAPERSVRQHLYSLYAWIIHPVSGFQDRVAHGFQAFYYILVNPCLNHDRLVAGRPV